LLYFGASACEEESGVGARGLLGCAGALALVALPAGARPHGIPTEAPTESRPQILISDATTLEGDSGTRPAVFTVSLSAPYALPVSVDYAVGSTLGANATPDIDYVASAGTLNFPPGVTSRTISVQVIGDRESESDETFTVTLGNAVNASVTGPAFGTILDDDAVGLAISDTAVAAPRTGMVDALFEVANPADPSETMVYFETSDGTATAPTDYTPTSGTLTFGYEETHKTITVPVKANSSGQGPRTFYVDLSHSSYVPIERSRGTATIYEPGLYPVAPCRILDTRASDQGPALSAGSTRNLVIGEKCGLPPTATAVSVNVTVVSPTAPGDLRLFAAGTALPPASSINYMPGQTRANNSVVSLGDRGWLSVFCEQPSGEVDLVLDVNGFFE
jgi:Calx-beta domain